MRVRVEGLGDLEFPDGMSREDIEKAIRAHPMMQGQTPQSLVTSDMSPAEQQMLGFIQPQDVAYLTGQAPAPAPRPEGPSIAGQVARGSVEQLPVGGAMVGGVLGSALGPFGAAGGAGLGMTTGTFAKNLIKRMTGDPTTPTPEQNLWEGAKAFPVGATGEIAGPYIAQGVNRVLSPFANLISRRMAGSPSVAAAQKMVEEGAPISVSEIAGTRTSRAFEWLADNLWPASSFMTQKRQSLQPIAEAIKDEFVATRGLYDTSKQGVSAAWEKWVDLAGGKEATYAMPETVKLLQEAMGKPFAQMGMFWKKHAATFLQDAEKGAITVQGIRDLFNTLTSAGVKGAERTAKMKIADAVMNDLSSAGNPEMVNALANARELSFMDRIAGPLRNLFNKAIILPSKAGESPVFNPSLFVTLWNQRRGDFLKNTNYGPEDIRVIDAFANKMKSVVGDLSKASKANQPISLRTAGQQALTSWPGVGMAIYAEPWLAVPATMDYFMARSLMNPNGVLRKFLTTGFKPPILSSKVGIMKGMEEILND